jgi:uncharacterized membrane protein YdjX (TVP38/TMEM64 family)
VWQTLDKPEHADPAAPPHAARDFRTVVRRLGAAGPLAIIAAALPAIGFVTLLSTLRIVGPWLKAQNGLGLALYVLVFAVCSGLAIFPTNAQSILGGWAFGFAVGFPAAMGGVLGGGLIGYTVARRATGDRVVRLIAEQPKWKAVHDALLGGRFWKTLLVITLVRLPPNSPFAITNLVLAATRAPLAAYTLGTLLGLAPRTAAAVFLAARFKELSFAEAQPIWMWGATAALTVVAVAIIGYIANRAVARVTGVIPRERSDQGIQQPGPMKPDSSLRSE